ncbi:MAG: 3-phosphoshikimate 1-carboxyvinyltransferase [Oscillospiraceae bacterium]|jgi:5-enolpyruvylshikimate-3-phosphate synthase|nr:3-phosphoshikimate 1-carboxyvinyltransferase [Oscillospiraceae bacterium]
MTVTIPNVPLRGNIVAPSSKSDLHRKLICAALFGELSSIACRDGELGQDILATIDCLTVLGAKITQRAQALEVCGIQSLEYRETPVLNCHESGSTLRFLLPVAAALCDHFIISGSGRLPERPVGTALEILRAGGCVVNSDSLPFYVFGRLSGHSFTLPGDVSSQYLSGLLLALPLLGGGEIRLSTPLQSAAYVDMTLCTLREFGVDYDVQDGIYALPILSEADIKKSIKTFVKGGWNAFQGGSDILKGINRLMRLKPARSALYIGKGGRDMIAAGQQMLSCSKELADAGKEKFETLHAAAEANLQIAKNVRDDIRQRKLRALTQPKNPITDLKDPITPRELYAEGDWSNAAFLLCSGAHPKASMTVKGLSAQSLQGDRAIVEILRRMGVNITQMADEITVTGGDLRGITLDVREIPDLVPPIAILMSVAHGESRITSGERLRLKESDRLSAIAQTINALGGNAHETADGLLIQGVQSLRGGMRKSFNDHRIAMALALAAAWCESPVIIADAGAVSKSYPNFYDEWRSLCHFQSANI